MDPSTSRTPNRTEPIPAVLRTAVQGTVMFPTDPGWQHAVSVWNLPADSPPHAFVVARSDEDVRCTLAYALHHGLRLATYGATGDAAASGDLTNTVLLWAAVPAPASAMGAAAAGTAG